VLVLCREAPAPWHAIKTRRPDVTGETSKPSRGNPELDRSNSSMEPKIPNGDDRLRVVNGQCARKVDSIGASERVVACQLTGVTFNSLGRLGRAG